MSHVGMKLDVTRKKGERSMEQQLFCISHTLSLSGGPRSKSLVTFVSLFLLQFVFPFRDATVSHRTSWPSCV